MKIGNILHINWDGIREYKKNFKELGDSVEALNAMEGSLNKETTNLIKSFKNGEVSLKGFLGSTVGLTVGITALVLGIQLAYKAWDKYANRACEE